jgi:hypothetical protein
MRYSLVLIFCIGLSAPANAQQHGGYVGFSGGGFRFEDRDDALGISVSDSALSYGLFGGYRFSNSFAVEGSLGRTTDFNDIFDEFFQQLPFIGGFVTSTHAEYRIETVRALGIAQIKRFGFFGGLGYHHSDADASLTLGGTGTVIDLDASDRGTTAVAGVQLDGNTFSYRFQHEWFDAQDRLDLSNTAFGFVIRF